MADPGPSTNAVDEVNRFQYVLGYYPSRPMDGHFRKIEVRVSRPGVTFEGGQYTASAVVSIWHLDDHGTVIAKTQGTSICRSLISSLRPSLPQVCRSR
jgi:hypothetical protein